MPRLNTRIQSAVCFLYGINPATGAVEPGGSGVLVGVNHPRFDAQQMFTRHTYAVTCAHVVLGGASIIRINVKNSGCRYIELEPHEWVISSETDLATIDITELLLEDDNITVIHEAWLADQEYINFREVGIGEDGFMLGMFAEEPGDKKNAVVARFGNVSLIADQEIKIRYRDGVRRTAHLFDMRSRGGFSGSPVFIYRTPSNDLRGIDQGPERPEERLYRAGRDYRGRIREMDEYWRARENTLIKVLGIHVGQYRDRIEVEKDRGVQQEREDAIKDGDGLWIPNSVSLVAPAHDVKTLLNHASLAATREKRDDMMADEPQQLLLERSIYSGWHPHTT